LSEIRATTISDAAGTGPITLTKQSAAKAWIDLVGTGTISIDASFNISSVSDNGTGNYTQSYSNAFSSNDLSFLTSSNGYMTRAYDSQATYADVRTYGSTASPNDQSRVHTAIFGDLA
jgi:hypothetical protein